MNNAVETHGQTVRVLLVEDSPTNRRISMRMLETLKCRVDVAANGREAVELMQRASYDVVFMDCHMPVMDGYQATAAIHRTAGQGRRVPIIAMTATATQTELQKCLEAGMDDFISKPAKLEELGAVLRRWTGRPIAPATSAPDTDPTAPAATLDPETFERILALSHTAGTEFVAELLETFVTDAADAIAAMREATQQGDVRRLWTVAHTLKGSSAGLGALEMAATCRQLEKLATEDVGSDARALLDHLQQQFVRLREALERQTPPLTRPSP